MTTDHPTMSQVEDRIIEVLKQRGAPMNMDDLEFAVYEKFRTFDTFEVQRAVRKLIDAGRAKLTSGYRVVAAA